MKPIEFPQHNVVYAKDQPPYAPLPAWTNGEETISCWRLSLWERLVALFGGRVWLRQLNFGQKLQPQLPAVESPFRRIYNAQYVKSCSFSSGPPGYDHDCDSPLV